MAEFGLTVKQGSGGKRLEMECSHQNGLLYVIPGDGSWVCSEELMHAHALAGFFKELMELNDGRHDIAKLAQATPEVRARSEPLCAPDPRLLRERPARVPVLGCGRRGAREAGLMPARPSPL